MIDDLKDLINNEFVRYSYDEKTSEDVFSTIYPDLIYGLISDVSTYAISHSDDTDGFQIKCRYNKKVFEIRLSCGDPFFKKESL